MMARPAPVETNRTRTNQVTVGILDSAIQHAPRGGQLPLKVFRGNGCTTSQIGDKRNGIRGKALPYVLRVRLPLRASSAARARPGTMLVFSHPTAPPGQAVPGQPRQA
jgi:hypothetical protein